MGLIEITRGTQVESTKHTEDRNGKTKNVHRGTQGKAGHGARGETNTRHRNTGLTM